MLNLKSGYPYSLIKNGLLFDYSKLESELNVDVLIMGGGISGALAAYHLVNAGVSCAVVDARSIGLGSTCASTSLLQYEIDVSLVELKEKVGLSNAVRSYMLGAEAIHKLKQIAGDIGYDDFSSRKSLYYAVDKKDVSFIREECKIRRDNGLQVQYLEQEEIQKKYGIKAPAAILSSPAAVTNAYTFTHALHQYNKGKGCTVFDRTLIKKIDHRKSGIKLLSESGIKISSKKLIYATGYEAVNHVGKKIVNLYSTYATISEQKKNLENFWDETIMWNTGDPYLYIRTTPDGRILVGGRDEKFYDPNKRDKIMDRKAKELEKDFEKLFPKTAFISEFSWAGVFGSTKDGLPYIGEYKGLPNGYFALGFGGNGITFSLIAAEMIRDMITGRPNADAKIFGFDR